MNGVRLAGKREAAFLEWTLKQFPLPARVRIPLQHSAETPAIACVRPGQHVNAGDIIAEPAAPASVYIHASISGKVTAIESFPHPELGEAPAVEIQAGRDDKSIETIPPKADPPGSGGKERRGWEDISEKDLLEMFRTHGLLALGREGVPGLHAQAAADKRRKAGVLVLNACETEPYVSTSYCLMMSHPVEMLKGAELLRRVTGAKKIIVAVAEDCVEAAEILKSKVFFLRWEHCEIRVLPQRHPQGMNSVLTSTVAGAERAAIYDPATAFAAYQAAALGKPFYETAVTVGGECVVQPRTVWACIGTSFQDLIKNCRGMMREPRKVLMGGPMLGITQLSLEVPVLKTTRAVLALPREATDFEAIEACIRCGRCIEACPAGISPAMIALAAEQNLFSLAREYGAGDCIACGNCAYVCPAKRPMTELVLYGAAGHI